MNLPLRREGFTLIEILIVVGIIGIIVAGVVPLSATFNRRKVFSTSLDSFVADLNLVRTKSLAASTASGMKAEWGVRVDCSNSGYILGYREAQTPGNVHFSGANTQSKTIAGTFTCGASPISFFFANLTGEASFAASLDIPVESSLGVTRTVTIFRNGKITVQ